MARGDASLRQRCVVHPPESDRAPAPSLETHDDEGLLAVRGPEVVLGDLPAARNFPLDGEGVPLPATLDLHVPVAISGRLLADLLAVARQDERRTRVGSERHGRVGLRNRERRGRLEHQAQRLLHSLALFLAHPTSASPPSPPAPAPAAPSPPPPPSPSASSTPPSPASSPVTLTADAWRRASQAGSGPSPATDRGVSQSAPQPRHHDQWEQCRR